MELQAKELTASVDTIRQLHEQLHNTKVRMGQIVMYTFSPVLLGRLYSVEWNSGMEYWNSGMPYFMPDLYASDDKSDSVGPSE